MIEYENKISNCKYIVKQIKDLGIEDKYIGFYFVVSIEELLLNATYEIKSFYKDVYPKIAKLYEKNDCSIERDIRHLINQTWQNGGKGELFKLFLGRKPSCCKFIYEIKNYLMRQII